MSAPKYYHNNLCHATRRATVEESVSMTEALANAEREAAGAAEVLELAMAEVKMLKEKVCSSIESIPGVLMLECSCRPGTR